MIICKFHEEFMQSLSDYYFSVSQCKREHFMSFKIHHLAFAIASFSAVSAHSAGLDRSGQDTSAFFQDGTYAEAVYTHIDADVSGKDSAGNKINDIAEKYDFFRYGVKTDVNDTFSVGVIYDEPFGALVDYTGTNNFTGDADAVALSTINTVASQERQDKLTETTLELANKAFTSKTIEEASAYLALAELFGGTQQSLERVKNAVDNGATPEMISQSLKASLPASAKASQERIATIQKSLASSNVSPETKAVMQRYLDQFTQSAKALQQAPEALDLLTSDNGNTSVEVHTRNLTGLVGMKLGANKNFQIFAGPQAQHLTGEVHLRGNAYKGATSYDAIISPDTAFGWVAGVAYTKPEIALKASLTYRSEIEHESSISEVFPLAPLRNMPLSQTNKFKVKTPESYNLDFQTGLSAKHRLLGTAKIRYVPWSDFKVTPTLYNQISGYNLVDYSDDQWSGEIGVAKQVNDKLAVSGTVGFDTGAGNPTTTLGPIEGYYSLGLGAKYNLTPNWAVSAGAKYLKFGNATAQLPDHKSRVGEFEDNDGYIVGVKLSYQQK